MKPQIRKALFAFAAASAFILFVTTSLASPLASRDFPGYWRVLYQGQEVFCDHEKDGHFLRVVCYTRKQMEERLRAVVIFDSGPALKPRTAQFLAAGRSG